MLLADGIRYGCNTAESANIYKTPLQRSRRRRHRDYKLAQLGYLDRKRNQLTPFRLEAASQQFLRRIQETRNVGQRKGFHSYTETGHHKCSLNK